MSDLETPSLPEMTESQEPVRQRRKRRRRRQPRFVRRMWQRVQRANWKIGLLMFVGAIAAIVMLGLIVAFNTRAQLENAWDGLSRVWTTVGNKPGTELTLSDFNRLQIAVSDMRSSLSSAQRQTLILRPITFASADLEVSLEALDAAEELTLAAQDILAGIEPALFFLTEGESEETVSSQLSSAERLVELLALGRGRFADAETHLVNAQAIIDGLDRTEISSELFVAVDGLARYQSQLQDINQMLQNSPGLLNEALGLNEPKTYLVLAHNNDELRPSGGYLSTYGWVTVSNGRIVNYDYHATTKTSPNPPPESYVSEIDLPEWWIPYGQPIYAAWDGSWYADFPATAEMAVWFYNNGGNPGSPVDGAIAIDIVGFEYLLNELDGVYVEGFDKTITVENFRDQTYLIRRERAGQGDLHKEFVAAVYRAILSGWQGVDTDQSVAMRGAALQALQEKHIMVHFTDDDLNDAVELLGWAGQQKPATENDYLMVVETNMGNKANRSVLRQWTYDVEIHQDGTLSSRAAVNYDYSDRVASQDPAVHPSNGSIDYSSLVQFFVPDGSTLEESNARFETGVVEGDARTTFIARVLVNYNSSQRLIMRYTTPALVERYGDYRVYRLVLQKQPGTLSEPVNVQVTLPPGASLIDSDPEPVTSYTLEQRILEFRVDLTTDQEIEIIFVE